MTMKAMGTTDDVTSCECCGRADLKSTVILVPTDVDGNPQGEPTYFGVVCAARATGRSSKDIKGEAKKADDERKAQEARERAEAHEAAMIPWKAFLQENGTGSEMIDQIQSLGGYAKARALFLEKKS